MEVMNHSDEVMACSNDVWSDALIAENERREGEAPAEPRTAREQDVTHLNDIK